MGKKIIVAGAGHGGLTAAGLLAEKGFDVTIYERGQKGKLGYDWTDIFDPLFFYEYFSNLLSLLV